MPPRFRGDIEGLRAVAVLLVVLDHAGVGPLDGGYVGVDVFFVISGFLITRLLLTETDHRGRPSILRFYARRARRILPLAALVTVAVVVATYVVLGSGGGNKTAADAVWVALFLGNVHFARSGLDYFAAAGFSSPLEHFWSLGVEEQFYVVWPVLVAAIALVGGSALLRRRLLLVVLGLGWAASLALSIHQSGTDPTIAYFSPLTRAHELATGAILAALLHRRGPLTGSSRMLGVVAAPVGLTLVVAAALLLGPGSTFPGALVLVPTLGAALVVLGGELRPEARVTRTLASAPLRYVGQRSYGFYLWHLPVLVLATIRAGEVPSPPVRVLLVLGSFALADVTYRLVEDPVRHATWLRRRSPAVSLVMGATLVAVVLGTTQASQALHRVPERTAAVVPVDERPDEAVVEAAVAASADPGATVPADVDPPVDAIAALGSPAPEETRCDRTYDATDADLCVLAEGANGEASDTVVLWGDSHAAMWAPGLLDVVAATGQRLVVLTKYGCPPLLDTPAWHPAENRPYDECAVYVASAAALIATLKPSTVILSGGFGGWSPDVEGAQLPAGYPENDAQWDPGLTASIAALRSDGARVVVLGDIASQAQDPTVCLVVHDRLADCSTPVEAALNARHLADERATTEAAGATYVSTVPWLCTDTVCPSVIGERVAYRDAFHITRQYSHWLADVLGTATGLS